MHLLATPVVERERLAEDRQCALDRIGNGPVVWIRASTRSLTSMRQAANRSACVGNARRSDAVAKPASAATLRTDTARIPSRTSTRQAASVISIPRTPWSISFGTPPTYTVVLR